MKKHLSVFIELLIISAAINAQYKVNKETYDFHTYNYQVGDPYNPKVMGTVSFFLPGLGQLFMGETFRGVGFLSWYVSMNVVKYYGKGVMYDNNRFDYHKYKDNYTTLRRSVFIVNLGLRIWSDIDAVHIAKINNLAFRDQKKISYDLQLLPYLGPPSYSVVSDQVPKGLTVLISF